MGSPTSEEGRAEDEVHHRVTLTRDFQMQTTEVTQAQFLKFMGYNPSGFTKCGQGCPVEQVNWHEAAAYCNALSDRASLGQCYECNGSGQDVTCSSSKRYTTPYACPGYRLPTEAEWEYAARAGRMESRHGDLNAVAWYEDNSSNTTHRVGGKRASAWGLYDMLGNVWEWCHDWYGAYPTGAVRDPDRPEARRREKAVRGGSWDYRARTVRAAHRTWNPPQNRDISVGFRPARSLP